MVKWIREVAASQDSVELDLGTTLTDAHIERFVRRAFVGFTLSYSEEIFEAVAAEAMEISYPLVEDCSDDEAVAHAAVRFSRKLLREVIDAYGES